MVPQPDSTVGIVGVTDRLYTDERSINTLRFFRGYPEETGAVDFEGIGAGEIKAGSYVLINRYRLSFMVAYYDYELPGFVMSVSENWEKRLDMRDGELYYAGGE